MELKVGKRVTSNPSEITNELNLHFINTVKELIKQKDNDSVYDSEIKHCPKSIFIYPVTQEEVFTLTKSFKGKSTAGNDIPEKLVKQCIHVINGPLTHIYNLSLTTGVFPALWKTAKVKPLHKKGHKYDINNYRPISIIPVFAKILEHLMYNRIISFLRDNKILYEAQNGFRKGKSTDTAVQSYTERIQKALDKRLYTIGIFNDLSTAYDVLNHNLLLEKLSYYGIKGSIKSWFRSYLSSRKQFIEISHTNMSSGKVHTYKIFLPGY